MNDPDLAILVTFHSSHFAMEAEQRLMEQGLSCRLIPTPRSISSECGFSLLTPEPRPLSSPEGVSGGCRDEDGRGNHPDTPKGFRQGGDRGPGKEGKRRSGDKAPRAVSRRLYQTVSRLRGVEHRYWAQTSPERGTWYERID